MILIQLTSRGLSTSCRVAKCSMDRSLRKRDVYRTDGTWTKVATDVVDYELELEVENGDQGSLDFQEFLQANDIEYKKAPSKLVRFIENKENN